LGEKKAEEMLSRKEPILVLLDGFNKFYEKSNLARALQVD
jgi:hypothetical protein